MAGVSLSKYRIPKDPDAHLRHVFRSNDRDDKEVWHKAYGLRTLLESVANYYNSPLAPNQLRKYRNDTRLLLEWIDTATMQDFKTLRSALSRMPWGVNVYNYLFTCWLVYRTRYQATLVCRIGKGAVELTAAQQVNALAEHLQELKKFATANNFDLLWSFDHDELPPKREDKQRQRINTFHVHVYCSHRALFRWCREEGNLLPFVPRHTVLTAVVPVRLPKLRGGGMIDWVYDAPGGAESPFAASVPNTLSYVAAKVAGLHMRQTRPNVEGQSYTVTHSNRTAKYVRKVVNDSDPKGKPRRHWGFIGFGVKGTKFELL
jgi:hypothetical protein